MLINNFPVADGVSVMEGEGNWHEFSTLEIDLNSKTPFGVSARARRSVFDVFGNNQIFGDPL